VSPDNAVLIITAAYTGLRWGELAGLQWDHVDLRRGEIVVDPRVGALHEIGGRLELGPPKTPASVRTIHLPPFLVDLLAQLRHRRPDTEFVFTGADGGLHRGSDPTSAVIGEEGTDAAFWAGSTVRGDRQLPESGGCCRWP
jgi:integrase